MKHLLILFCFLLKSTSLCFSQETGQNTTVYDSFLAKDLSKVQTISELAAEILGLTTDHKEQLRMLLLWSDKYMYADTERFFNNREPLSVSNAFKQRIGLCDEFSGIINEFCKAAKIPCFKVVGYVEEERGLTKDLFEEENHVWNAVYIDSSWLLCDLFWSTNKLSSDKLFLKKLDEKYFLANASVFIENHLPASPVFQLTDYPIKPKSFRQVDVEMLPYCNFRDSLNRLLKLKDQERTLQIAQQAYRYNNDNPNILAIAYYNFGVFIIKNKSEKKEELIIARKLFADAMPLMSRSSKPYIKGLIASCKSGIDYIDRKLAMK
ncbi:MAG TPA: transglutaminase domain-containing protein [Flavipsychrobacter sp.]|nr:transglutaminase domain-containing protein [Flavipsychrobacter sp.]